MKKTALILLAALLANAAMAQKYVPKIGVNAVINYDVVATASGQQIPLTLTMESVTDPVIFRWAIPGLGIGKFQLSPAGFQSGTKMRLEEPQDGTTKLKDDETIMVLSKDSFNNLVKNQTFMLNKGKFDAKPDTLKYKINDKEADVIHAATANGKVHIWVLNNPDFPLICRLTGNPGGIDFDLLSIKEQ